MSDAAVVTPNPAEVAQLQVGGTMFEDWETVWVQHRWADGWPLFRFTAAEYSPVPAAWGALQFKPGDSCQIILGGQLAITGIILTRQTAYDAVNHQVELQGAGRTWAAGTSSIDAKKANFDKMNVQAATSKAYGEFGVAVLPIGLVDPTPFPYCQAQPGELVFDFCDKIARQRGATLGSDHLGNMLLIGEHSGTPIEQQLTEGENIKKMQCVISNEMMAAIYNVLGQAANAEDVKASASAMMEKEAISDLYKGYMKFIQTVLEHPAMSEAEVLKRVMYEKQFRDGTQVRAHITVQGWLRDGKQLWRCGDDVFVYAPMAMLNFVMKIQTATFQQDNQSGTTTVLEMVMPWMLSDKPFTGVGNPADVPSPPATNIDQLTKRLPGPV